MRIRRHSGNRSGFTLVELMVAAAICVIIMSVLATVFQLSIDTMREMRSHTDLADQLRAASEVMKRDLRASHFMPQEGKPNMGLRVSDQRLDQFTAPNWPAPLGGFFRIRSTSVTPEGLDAQAIYSTRADSNAGHLLHFTTVLSGSASQGTTQGGGSDQNLFAAQVNGTMYSSPSAEIAYFLDPTPTGSTGSLSTYNLIRRQRLVAYGASDQGTFPPNGTDTTVDPGVISLSTTNTVNTMANLVDWTNRLGGASGVPKVAGNDSQLSSLSTRLGDDIMLSNVISFEVKVNWTTSTSGGSPAGRAFGSNTDYPFDTLQDGSGNAEFDTRPSPPQMIRVIAVQIRIRIWDPKIHNARQITIVQDL